MFLYNIAIDYLTAVNHSAGHNFSRLSCYCNSSFFHFKYYCSCLYVYICICGILSYVTLSKGFSIIFILILREYKLCILINIMLLSVTVNSDTCQRRKSLVKMFADK